MHLYIKLTLAITAVLVAAFFFVLIVKLLIVGAILAGIVLAVLFLFHFVRALLRSSVVAPSRSIYR